VTAGAAGADVADVTRAEAVVVAVAASLAATVVFGYLLGRLGVGVAGWALLPVTLAGLLSAGIGLWRRASGPASDVLLVVALAAGSFGLLLWRAWPQLLPPGAGPDLTHHLLLIDYIERTGRVVALSAIDNLGKGAAGQMIQCANLMLGLDETAGLTTIGVYP